MKTDFGKNDSFKRMIALGVALGLAYWLAPVLFWVILGVYGAVLLTRRQEETPPEEEIQEDTPTGYEKLIQVRPDAVLKEHGVILTQGRWLIQVREDRSPVVEGAVVIFAHCPIVTPIPFCFTIRPRKSLSTKDKLVSNTLLPSSFEYELREVELPSPLHARFESATNAATLFKQLLESPFMEEVSALLHHQQLLLQEVCFDGSRVHLSALPAQPTEVSADGFEQISDVMENLADSLREFIDVNELVEAVRAKS